MRDPTSPELIHVLARCKARGKASFFVPRCSHRGICSEFPTLLSFSLQFKVRKAGVVQDSMTWLRYRPCQSMESKCQRNLH